MKHVKRFLTMVLACALTSSLAVSSPVKAESNASSADGIKIAISRDVNALDGFTGNNVAYGIAYEIFDTLTVLNPDSTLRAGAAESWEQVDDYTWKFNLRDGIQFTNGEELTAESAAYSVNYMAGLDTTYQNYKQWGESWPPEATVEGENSILIKTPRPNLAVPALMTRCAMLPMEASKEEGFFQNPIGSGAYKLSSWNVGVQVVLEANEEYWGGAPAIKKLTYDIMSDSTARSAAIQSGEYDFVENVPFDTALTLKDAPMGGLELLETPLTGMWYVYFNGFSSNPFILNPEFRKAMLYAIDHQPIADFILGGLTVSPQNITPMDIAGTYDAGGYPERDVEKAQELAASLGYNGEEIKIAYPGTQFNNDVEILEIVLAQLQEAGFNVTYQEYDKATWSGQYKKTDAYDIAVNGYGGTYTGDSEQYYTQGVRNLGWTYDEAEALLDQIYSEGITPEEREQALKDMIAVCWEETPYLWAAEAVGLWAINPALQGYEILPHGQVNFIAATIQ